MPHIIPHVHAVHGRKVIKKPLPHSATNGMVWMMMVPPRFPLFPASAASVTTTTAAASGRRRMEIEIIASFVHI